MNPIPIGEEYPLFVYDPPSGNVVSVRVSHVDDPEDAEALVLDAEPSVPGHPVVYSSGFTPSKLGWHIATFSVDDRLPAGVHRFYVSED